uniref:BZIP domain-containing protein n=1 Tax=Meloidogyne incognita TaxID=6306 RepID=A0A914KXS4_MELIC
MHSHMSRVSSKQERMMLTEQESSPTGGILEQLSPMSIPLTVSTPLDISTSLSSLESSLPHHHFSTNPPPQPQYFNQPYNSKTSLGNNPTMWTTNVDGEQQRRDSQYRFGMAENGVERGGGFGRGGDEPFNYWSFVPNDSYMDTGVGSTGGRGIEEGIQGGSYPPPGTSHGYSDWIANSSTAAKAGPGTQAAASNYIQNANNLDYSPPHQNPPQYAQQQNEHWIDGNFEENNTIWQQQESNEQQQYFNSEGHYQNYQQLYGTFTGEEEYMEDLGTSTIPTVSSTVSSTSPSASAFEPLSVCSSACTWSSGGGGEYSSSSQDEIYEEIQRECAEIERRSFSRSPQEKGTEKQSSKNSSKILEKLPRAERKKELNRVAATRYREKKRKEREEAVGEMAKLESRNLTLKSEIAAVQAEINYLKGLAKEIENVRRTKIIS